ncbi:hypothetical protein ACLMJK_008960 [Lecanora helva]
MAALHSALQSLSPTPFSSVPTAQSEAASYLQTAFQKAQTIIDSVPLPPPDDSLVRSRPRSATTSSTASNVSEISASSARSDPLDPSNLGLQKEWGKPIKLNAKDNPLNMSVYKCAGKDGRGAWFARRSVHEGLGFNKWKLALQREFPETLEVQGSPGEGNIRGIGGERRVERMEVKDTGVVEVYHLSAQFPGPTTPRDFVTLLLTSSSALHEPASSPHATPSSDNPKSKNPRFSDHPRHFMVISRPCKHPECPPRDGFIRGQYESVEFIREIPKKSPRLSSSMTDLRKGGRAEKNSLEKEALLRKTEQMSGGSIDNLPNGEHISPAQANNIVREGRKRGKTISFAQSRGSSAKGEALDRPHDEEYDETNPVEWIMITRSDPGGSVPRFMVERGTPSGIVADASKFLDWACKKEHPEDEVEALEKGNLELIKERTREELEAYETNGHLAGLDGTTENVGPPAVAIPRHASLDIGATSIPPQQEVHQQGGLLSSVAEAAYAGIETYAPQAVIDRLPGHQRSQTMSSIADTTSIPGDPKSAPLSPVSSTKSSIASFLSAEEGFEGDDALSTKSMTSPSKSLNSKDQTGLSQHEKELAKLNDRKRLLNEKLAKAREKQGKDKEELTSKEEQRLRKTEEKHAKEIKKQEDKYKKELARLESKRQKEAAKVEDRKKKASDRDEKARLLREKEEMKQELDMVNKEREILRDQVGALQRENTSLVVRLGKIEEGKGLLKEVKSELEGGGRSRSSSLKRGKASAVDKGKEVTVLMGEGKKEGVGEEEQ